MITWLEMKGAKGAYIEGISAFKGQYEFLLDYNCEFRLTAKSGRVVYLEVVVWENYLRKYICILKARKYGMRRCQNIFK